MSAVPPERGRLTQELEGQWPSQEEAQDQEVHRRPRKIWDENTEFICGIVSSCLSYWLFITFLYEKQRLSPAVEWRWLCLWKLVLNEIVATVATALLTESSVNFPPENSLHTSRERPTASAAYWWQLRNYVIQNEKRNFDTFQDVWWVNHNTFELHPYDHKQSADTCFDRWQKHTEKTNEPNTQIWTSSCVQSTYMLGFSFMALNFTVLVCLTTLINLTSKSRGQLSPLKKFWLTGC